MTRSTYDSYAPKRRNWRTRKPNRRGGGNPDRYKTYRTRLLPAFLLYRIRMQICLLYRIVIFVVGCVGDIPAESSYRAGDHSSLPHP